MRRTFGKCSIELMLGSIYYFEGSKLHDYLYCNIHVTLV